VIFLKLFQIYHQETGALSDDFFKGHVDYPVRGAFKTVTLLPYTNRVLSWRPLCSQFDEFGNITVHGAEFLKNRFIAHKAQDGFITIIPRRDHKELYGKLLKPTSSLVSIADHILKIRAFMYFAQFNPHFYMELLTYHQALMAKYGKKHLMASDLNKSKRDKSLERMKQKLGQNFLEIIVKDCPTYEEVCNFYLIKDAKDYNKRLLACIRSKNDDVTIFSALAD